MDMPRIERCSTGIVGAGACHPLMRVPTGFGGITITAAYYDPGIAAGTPGLTYLVDAGTALGTAQSATVGTITAANGTFTADVQKAFNLTSTPYVAEGHWISIFPTAALLASSAVIIEFKPGK